MFELCLLGRQIKTPAQPHLPESTLRNTVTEQAADDLNVVEATAWRVTIEDGLPADVRAKLYGLIDTYET